MSLVTTESLDRAGFFTRLLNSVKRVFSDEIHEKWQPVSLLTEDGTLDLSDTGMKKIILPANIVIEANGNLFLVADKHINVESGHRDGQGQLWFNTDQPVFDPESFDSYAYRKVYGVIDHLDHVHDLKSDESQLEFDFCNHKESCVCQVQHA